MSPPFLVRSAFAPPLIILKEGQEDIEANLATYPRGRPYKVVISVHCLATFRCATSEHRDRLMSFSTFRDSASSPTPEELLGAHASIRTGNHAVPPPRNQGI